MAWSSCLRRSACAVPFTIRSLGSHIEQSGAIFAIDLIKRRRLIGAHCFPLLRFSTNPVPNPSLKQTLGNSSDRVAGSPIPTGGLPFGYTEVRYDEGTLFLTRKSKDEIIQVEVSVDTEYARNWEMARKEKYLELTRGEHLLYDLERQLNEEEEEEAGDIPCLKMKVKILCAEGFNKHIKFDVLLFPGDHDQVAIQNVEMSARHGGLHLEEFEDFLKKRGIEPRNLNFLFDHIRKLKGLDEEYNAIGKEVPPKA